MEKENVSFENDIWPNVKGTSLNVYMYICIESDKYNNTIYI